MATATTQSSSSSPTTFIRVSVASLSAAWLNDPTVLILDIRPYAAHASARLPNALSLSVPSTLLKRPLFSLQRLCAMLPTHSARARFSSWPSASRIIVYDADSTALPDSSNILGLLRKFENVPFNGQLAWLHGGFQAVWREQRHLIDSSPPYPDSQDDLPPSSSSATSSHLELSVFNIKDTPLSHFSLSSPTPSKALPTLSTPHPIFISLPKRPTFNPFFDTVRQNIELSHGITERIPLRLPRRVRKRANDLPSPWLKQIARRAALLPRLNSSDSSSESDDCLSPDPADVEEGTEALAMQFYRIELAEQRRLMGVMEHHSKESGHLVQDGLSRTSSSFPFSITAGVEKGAKNRYHHIWPFEHARVRLRHKQCSSGTDCVDDYVNASYVQPLGTTKRYIATQGPLPTTFTDFWTLCWEQNVHVIVMLTREIEGASVKCGAYWTDTEYGPLRLQLVSTTHEYPESQQQRQMRQQQPEPNNHLPHRHEHTHKPELIKRVFELRHTGYPAAGVRTVVHFQYLGWPDMNVPDDPRGLLGLILEVDRAVKDTCSRLSMGGGDSSMNIGKTTQAGCDDDDEFDEATGIAKYALKEGATSPLLLHCSAGVGRTGGFIAVDSILDGIRREVRKKGTTVVPAQARGGVAEMDVDLGASHSSDVDVDVDVVMTPMLADNDFGWQNKGASTSTSTRKWAENVLDSVQQQFPANARTITAPPLSSLSSSAFPSSVGSIPTSGSSLSGTSCSEDSFGLNPASSSSINTSASSISMPVPENVTQRQRLPPLYTRNKDLPGAVLERTQSEPQSQLQQLDDRTFSTPATATTAMAMSFPRGSFVVPAKSTPVDGVSRSQGHGPRRRESRGRSADVRSSEPPANKSALTSYLSEVEGSSNKYVSSLSLPGLVSSLGRKEAVAGSSVSGSTLSTFGSNSRNSMPYSTKWRQPSPDSMSFPPSVSGSESTSGLASDVPKNNDTRHWHTTVDYKDPRPLHRACSPVGLSTCEEPIWEVVQDMREQRMSLCQSLRQYVFVHAAVIEGALMIVDEERAAREMEMEMELELAAEGRRDESGSGSGSAYVNAGVGVDLNGSPSTNSTMTVVPSGSRPSSAGNPTHPVASLHTMKDDDSTSSLTGKRCASPTELPKEGMRGEVLFSKRPSTKRRHKSGGGTNTAASSPGVDGSSHLDGAMGVFKTTSLLSLVANPLSPMPEI